MGHAKKVTWMVGFVPLHVKMEVAIDPESSDTHTVCTGDGTHAPSRVKQSFTCPICETSASSTWGFKERGVERDGAVVVLTPEEIAAATGAPHTGRKDAPPIELAFHNREKLFAATVAADSVQNVYPDRGGEKAYALLRNALARRPDVVGAMIWAPSSKNALWVLEVVGSRIVASKRCWPEMVRATTEIADVDLLDVEQEMFGQLVEGSIEDFDLGKYVDQSKLSLEELIASRTAVSGATALKPGVAGRDQIPDLLANLQASLAALQPAKKPPAKRAPAKKAPAKKAAAKKAPAKRAAKKAAPLAKAG